LHATNLETVIGLAAIAFCVDLGEDFPTNAELLIEEGVIEYVPEGWKDKKVR
jgi:hypothetical protein